MPLPFVGKSVYVPPLALRTTADHIDDSVVLSSDRSDFRKFAWRQCSGARTSIVHQHAGGADVIDVFAVDL